MAYVKSIFFGSRSIVTEEVLDKIRDLKTREDDVFIVTYPRSGTTWTQHIMLGLKHDAEFVKKIKDKKLLLPNFPFLDIMHFLVPNFNLEALDSPRFMKTHLPVEAAPREIMENKRKCVIVLRNPKSVCVSYYKFHVENHRLITPDSFDQFVDWFLNGPIAYNLYWDWMIGWLDYADSNKDTCLVLCYEDMMKDFESNVEKLSSFLGYAVSEEKLTELKLVTSFKEMNPQVDSVGRGEINSYEQQMSGETIAKFDRLTEEKLAHTKYLENFLL